MRNFSIDIVWAKSQMAVTAFGGWLGYLRSGNCSYGGQRSSYRDASGQPGAVCFSGRSYRGTLLGRPFPQRQLGRGKTSESRREDQTSAPETEGAGTMSEARAYTPTVTRVKTVRVIPPTIQPLSDIPAFSARPSRRGSPHPYSPHTFPAPRHCVQTAG